MIDEAFRLAAALRAGMVPIDREAREHLAGVLEHLAHVALAPARSAVAAERERIRALVEAVRDANAASQGEDDRWIYTPAAQRAWQALMDGLGA